MSKILLAKQRVFDVFSRSSNLSKKEEALPKVALLSNNKMKLFASSLGHVSLWDGLLPIFSSSFEKKTLERGLRAVVKTENGIFSPMPLVPIPKGFRGEYSFSHTVSDVTYTADFSGKGKSFSVSAVFSLSPISSLLQIFTTVKGNIGEALAALSFSPVLKKESSKDSWLFFDRYDSAGRYLIRERHDKNARCEALYFGISRGADRFLSLTAEGKDISKRVRCVFPVTESACVSLAVAKEEEELFYLLQKENDIFLARRSWESLAKMQISFSGFGEKAARSEEKLLCALIFGTHRFSLEKQRSLQGVLSGVLGGLSQANPTVAFSIVSFDERTKECLIQMIALFRYLCIRGFSFDLVFLCENEDVRAETAHFFEENGYDFFVFYAGGIFLLERGAVGERVYRALRETAVSVQSSKEDIFFE